MDGNRRRIVIMGAAGRDFHNFNVMYRDRSDVQIVAFTAAQIPGIDDRLYPPALAGDLYPAGIPILPEQDLERIVADHGVEEVQFAYSDVPHAQVMHVASRVLATGADFHLAGPASTMLDVSKPSIAVCAVRTGCGKSQVSRMLAAHLRQHGLSVAVIRHPMPYGDLAAQAVQRFATRDDLTAAHCTIEEREEYEPIIAENGVVWAGVDYGEIFQQASAESDVLIWDGGNNDFSFLQPDLTIVVADALRPAHLTTHHPGETVLRMADIVVINKVDAAGPETVSGMQRAINDLLPGIPVVRAASPVTLEDPDAAAGKRVVVVEDGPTLTHGGAVTGAGYQAVSALPGVQIIDPRPYAVAALRTVFDDYPHLGPVLPAMGYGDDQVKALAATLRAVDADVVVAGTPIDLSALVQVNKPIVRAHYNYSDTDPPFLTSLVDDFLRSKELVSP